MSWTRRQVLAGLGAALAPTPALGFGEATKVDVAELDLGAGSLSRPGAWKRLLAEVIQTTSVECARSPVHLVPDDPALFEHPFAVLLGDGRFTMPSDRGLEQLSRYLSYGGFLVVDDTTGEDANGFDAAARELCGRLFPTRPLGPLPEDHSIFRSFFLIDRPLGRIARYRHVEGVTVGNLTPLVYIRNDLSGALDRGDDGRNRNPCVPDGERQRREAVKLALNLVMYSLTANYKRDQTHVRQLMLEHRLPSLGEER